MSSMSWYAGLSVSFLLTKWILEGCHRYEYDDAFLGHFINSSTPFCRAIHGKYKPYSENDEGGGGWSIMMFIVIQCLRFLDQYVYQKQGVLCLIAIFIYHARDYIIAWAEYFGIWPLGLSPTFFGYRLLDSGLNEADLPELEEIDGSGSSHRSRMMNGNRREKGGGNDDNDEGYQKRRIRNRLSPQRQQQQQPHHHCCKYAAKSSSMNGNRHQHLSSPDLLGNANREDGDDAAEGEDNKAFRAPWCCEQCGQVAATELTASKRVRPDGWLVYDRVVGVVPYEVLEQWRVQEERRRNAAAVAAAAVTATDIAEARGGGGGGGGTEGDDDVPEGNGRRRMNTRSNRKNSSSSSSSNNQNNQLINDGGAGRGGGGGLSNHSRSSSTNNLKQRSMPPVRRPPDSPAPRGHTT